MMSEFASPALFKQISNYVHHYAEAAPRREAIIFGQDKMTYGDLSREVSRYAKAFIAAGIKRGDRVACMSNARPEYWVSFLAASEIGAIWCGLNPKYQYRELQYVIDDASPGILLVFESNDTGDLSEKLDKIAQNSNQLKTIISCQPSNAVNLQLSEFLLDGESINDTVLESHRDAVDEYDPALIVYTSGSTGEPKGALLSHYGLAYGGVIMGRRHKVEVPSIICSFPINHVACVSDICCANLISGGTIIFVEKFEPEQFLSLLEKQSVNVWAGVPTMFQMIMDLPTFSLAKLKSVQLIFWGGAAMPRTLLSKLSPLGAQFLGVYGLTETTCNTIYSDPDADIESLIETLGKPAPELRCRIVKTDGMPCAVGEEGELQFLCKANMLAYYRRPEETKKAFTEDGWLRTGDVARQRADGNIVFSGRLKEMFKSGGINIYPREIELLLEQHPAISMAAVIGVPDELYQEVGYAYVTLHDKQNATEDEIKAFAKEQLANYKVPKRVFVCSELPMLPVGKIDKVGLKDRTIREAELK